MFDVFEVCDFVCRDCIDHKQQRQQQQHFEWNWMQAHDDFMMRVLLLHFKNGFPLCYSISRAHSSHIFDPPNDWWFSYALECETLIESWWNS